jgi:hypothetical protein
VLANGYPTPTGQLQFGDDQFTAKRAGASAGRGLKVFVTINDEPQSSQTSFLVTVVD